MSSSSNRRMASLVGHIHSHQPSPPEGAAPSAVAGFSGTGPTAHGLAHRPTVTGANGMVACAHSLAAQAGLRILANGGNAIDAGVAVAAALNVVEPFMSGLGGGGWMQIFHKESGEHVVIDYCGVSPAAADCTNPSPSDPSVNMFDVPGAKTEGPLAPVVPGSPAGWFAVLERFGTCTPLEVFTPAIELAELGFPLTKFGQRQFPGPAGSAYATVSDFGDILKQPDLARTYRRLAAGGVDEFYRGEVGAELAAYMSEVGGLITTDDLAAYQPRWLEPYVHDHVRGHTISACPPPNHGTQILECLNILEGYPLAEWGHNSEQTLHHFFEAMKRAAADRAVWRTAEATPGLLSKGYAESRRAGIGEKATPSATQAGNFTDGSKLDAGDPMGWYKRYGSTTHFDVVDKDGNCLGCTHSLGGGFGSKVVVPSLGVALNNFHNWADTDPASPAAIRGGGLASETDISCMSPIMIWADEAGGQLEYALGTPGSFGIPQTTTQLIMNVLDFGMDMQEAIEAPRVSLPYETEGIDTPSAVTVNVEGRIDEAVCDGLTSRGHIVELKEDWTMFFGGMQGVQIHESGGLSGGADPRRDGTAIGY